MTHDPVSDLLPGAVIFALERMRQAVRAAGAEPCRWEMTPRALARVLVALRQMSADDMPLNIETLDMDSIRVMNLPVTCVDSLPYGHEVRLLSETQGA